MKALLVSFVVGLAVGIAYGVIRVKSPAPPIVALIGLLGMVLGEQFGGWALARNTPPPSAHIVSVRKDGQPRPKAQSTISTSNPLN